MLPLAGHGVNFYDWGFYATITIDLGHHLGSIGADGLYGGSILQSPYSYAHLARQRTLGIPNTKVERDPNCAHAYTHDGRFGKPYSYTRYRLAIVAIWLGTACHSAARWE
jgi:hypothetical protein